MLLKLDFSSGTPIYRQIRDQIVLGIADGALTPGERLPTIRALAEESGINMMTVNKAYQMLKQEGYILADRRSGATVAGRKPGGLSQEAEQSLRLIASEARLGELDKAAFLSLCERLFDRTEE